MTSVSAPEIDANPGTRRAVDGRVPIWLWMAFAVCVGAGVFFRIYRLDYQYFWHDEIWTAYHVTGHLQYEIPRIFDRAGGTVGPEALQSLQRFDTRSGIGVTLKNLAAVDSQHPPLYYFLTYGWTRCFGVSVFSFRALPALVGVLTIGAFYWLALRLFHSRLAAVIGTSLFSVSPIHIIYAQEAREYSLWTLMTLLSTIALLAALRRPQSKRSWALYAVTIAISLYSFPLTASVIVVHAVAVAFFAWRPEALGSARGDDDEAIVDARAGRTRIFGFIIAAAAGCLVFAPWFVDMWTHRESSLEATSWQTRASPFPVMAKGWIDSFGTLIVDLRADHRIVAFAWIVSGLIVLSLLVVGTSRRLRGWQGAMIVCLFLFPFLTLAAPDLLLGGCRANVRRYLMPAYLGAGLAIAGMLSLGMAAHRSWATKLCASFVLVILVIAGMVTAYQHSQSVVWWNKVAGRASVAECVQGLANATHPLVLFERGNPTGTAVALSRYVHPDTKFRLLNETGVVAIPQNEDEIYLLMPTPRVQQQLVDQGYRLEELARMNGGFCRLRPADPAPERAVKSSPASRPASFPTTKRRALQP